MKLVELTGISKSALGCYENDEYKEINHGNLMILADFYEVSVDYLLCRTENKKHINTALTDLHLTDDMIDLLVNGRVNNRLLCELATHKNFIKLMADAEIYVDVVRHEIMERYRPGEADPYIRILQAAHLDEDVYFSELVSSNLIQIIWDIRVTHKGDSKTAPVNSVAEELKQDIEEAMNFKGSD